MTYLSSQHDGVAFFGQEGQKEVSWKRKTRRKVISIWWHVFFFYFCRKCYLVEIGGCKLSWTGLSSVMRLLSLPLGIIGRFKVGTVHCTRMINHQFDCFEKSVKGNSQKLKCLLYQKSQPECETLISSNPFRTFTTTQ